MLDGEALSLGLLINKNILLLKEMKNTEYKLRMGI